MSKISSFTFQLKEISKN